MICKNNPTLFFQYLAIAKIEKKAELEKFFERFLGDFQ